MAKKENPNLNEIVEAMRELGGICTYPELYKRLRERNVIKKENYASEVEWKSRIRFLIEKFSSDSKTYQEKDDDIFYSVNGIGGGVWGLRDYDSVQISDEFKQDKQQDNIVDPESMEFPEGTPIQRKHKSYERNAKLIRFAKSEFKKKHGVLFCEACGFNFMQKYGKWGEDYIEAHHDVNPISERQEKKGTKISDLVMLCANCHKIVHRKRPWLRAEDLKEIIENNQKTS